jgi:hypothetical protein
MADSELEKQWLNFLEKKKLNLPTGAQKLPFLAWQLFSYLLL